MFNKKKNVSLPDVGTKYKQKENKSQSYSKEPNFPFTVPYWHRMVVTALTWILGGNGGLEQELARAGKRFKHLIIDLSDAA